MLSINDLMFHKWWLRMTNYPKDTHAHLDQLEFMTEKQGLNIDKPNIEGFSIAELILYELDHPLSETHRLNFEQVLLWVCGRITPTFELLRTFHYVRHFHALEEILKRYEGPIINFSGWMLDLEFLEVLIGFENVVDTLTMEKIYSKALESNYYQVLIPKY
jgi:hypothetical protein